MTEQDGERWLISGRVQGVGYRAWLQAEAASLGLSGWVRNLTDGRVEALVQGPAGVRQQLRELAGRGPSGARVEAVVVSAWAASPCSGFATVSTSAAPLNQA